MEEEEARIKHIDERGGTHFERFNSMLEAFRLQLLLLRVHVVPRSVEEHQNGADSLL
jgi:hypothetical protein